LVETLYAADEIRVERPSEIDDVKISDRELDMAFSLLEELREPFEPKKYPDEYRDAVLALIESKEQGAVTAPTAEEPAKVIDLMEALKASVSVAKKRREEKEPAASKGKGRRAS
jgi:DNA end-binding protein Ku